MRRSRRAADRAPSGPAWGPGTCRRGYSILIREGAELMRPMKLGIFTAMTLFILGAFATADALAADANTPRILCLTGENCTELEGTFKAGVNSVIVLSGLTFAITTSEFKLKGCKEAGAAQDTNLCEAAVDLFGWKKGEVGCRTEDMKSAVKDPVETVLMLLDAHVAAGEAEGKLNPMLLGLALGVLGEEEVTIACGLVKIKIKGTWACLLLPGLENIPTSKEVAILCKVNEKTKDVEEDKCTVLCESLEKNPLLLTLNGSTFEDSAMLIHAKGKLNKDVFIDD